MFTSIQMLGTYICKYIHYKSLSTIWKFTIFTPKCWERLYCVWNLIFFFVFQLIFHLVIYCMHVCTWQATSASVENKRRNLWKSVLSLPCRSQESNPSHHQVGCKHLYRLDQLTDPILCLHILFVCKIYLFLVHACGCCLYVCVPYTYSTQGR